MSTNRTTADTDACPICGQHVVAGKGIEGFRGWENADGEILVDEVLLSVHLECFMRTPSSERVALLDQATKASVRP